jgi:hypothetical protein
MIKKYSKDKSVIQQIKYKLILITSLLLIVGCAVKEINKKDTTITIKKVFDDKEVSWFKNKGNGHIKGIAKFKSKN